MTEIQATFKTSCPQIASALQRQASYLAAEYGVPVTVTKRRPTWAALVAFFRTKLGNFQ